MNKMNFDTLDNEIIRLLTENGRMPTGDLAKRLDVTAPTIRKRIRDLEKKGIFKVSGLIDPSRNIEMITAQVAMRVTSNAKMDHLINKNNTQKGGIMKILPRKFIFCLLLMLLWPAVVAFADTEYPEATTALMEFLVQPENYGAFSAGTLSLPANKDVASTGVDFETDDASVLGALAVPTLALGLFYCGRAAQLGPVRGRSSLELVDSIPGAFLSPGAAAPPLKDPTRFTIPCRSRRRAHQ